MSKLYVKLPSEILGITEEYDAFCFNEACAFIRIKMEGEDKEQPRFVTEYKSFADIYSDYE